MASIQRWGMLGTQMASAWINFNYYSFRNYLTSLYAKPTRLHTRLFIKKLFSLPSWPPLHFFIRKIKNQAWELKSFWRLYLPYSCKKKHVLLFRKSDFLFFKVSNSNMSKFFFRKKTFLFLIISLRYSGYMTNTWCEYLRDWTTFIFWCPMSIIEFVSISNMGCH